MFYCWGNLSLVPGLWGGLIAFWPQCKYLRPHLPAWAWLNNLWPCSALSHWQGTVFWRAVTARRMIWLQWRHINSWSCVVYGPWCGNLEEWMCQASAFVLYNLFWEKVARRAEVFYPQLPYLPLFCFVHSSYSLHFPVGWWWVFCQMYSVKCWCIFLLRVLWILLSTRSWFFFPYLNIFPSSGHVVLSWVKFQHSQLGMLHEQFYSQLLFCVLNVLQSWLVMCYCFQEIKHLFTM